jgi:hypothetical protein
MVKDLMAGLANNKIEIMKTNLHTNGQMIQVNPMTFTNR